MTERLILLLSTTNQHREIIVSHRLCCSARSRIPWGSTVTRSAPSLLSTGDSSDQRTPENHQAHTGEFGAQTQRTKARVTEYDHPELLPD